MRSLFVIFSLWAFLPSEPPTPIFWCEGRPLSWDDYHGKTRRSGFAAETSTMLIMEPEIGPWWSGKGTYSVICQMNPDRSWADRSRRTSRLLSHEQLHFDIAEWHARMLRSQVSTEPVTEKEAIRAFDKIFEELEEIQDRYDRDTDHGLKPDVQRDWENRVQRELKKWERFSKSDCDWG